MQAPGRRYSRRWRRRWILRSRRAPRSGFYAVSLCRRSAMWGRLSGPRTGDCFRRRRELILFPDGKFHLPPQYFTVVFLIFQEASVAGQVSVPFPFSGCRLSRGCLMPDVDRLGFSAGGGIRVFESDNCPHLTLNLLQRVSVSRHFIWS